MQKVFTIIAVLGLVAITSVAETVTNRGVVIEVNTLRENPDGDTTVVSDISKAPTQSDRRGLLIAEFDFSVDGTDYDNDDRYAYPTVDTGTLPKGAILQPAVIEVVAQIVTTPANSPYFYSANNYLALTVDGESAILIGASTNLAAVLPASDVYRIPHAVASTDAISTAGRVRFDSLGATNALNYGRVILYQPYILGSDQ